MRGSYLMMVFLSDESGKLKKCICDHRISQEDLLKKINYNSKNSLTEFDSFKCDNCHTKIKVAII